MGTPVGTGTEDDRPIDSGPVQHAHGSLDAEPDYFDRLTGDALSLPALKDGASRAILVRMVHAVAREISDGSDAHGIGNVANTGS